MLVVGVVGSPRKDGLTNKLVSEALAGAQSMGATIKKIYLIDYEIEPWTPEHTKAPEELNKIMREADGYIIGAPVYYLDINGLTKDFLDTVDLGNSNGKPGFGITIAGGTGKGLVLAIRSIYYFFFCKNIRALEPLPVSRFNFEKALKRAKELGRKLAKEAKMKKPFKSLEERIRYFSSIKYMNMDMVDEILLLAEQLLKSSPKQEYKEEAMSYYKRAKELISKGEKDKAITYAVKAYELLYY